MRFNRLVEEAMGRREFIQKVGKGAAATGLTPGGVVGKVLGGIGGATAKSGVVSSFLPDDVIMGFVNFGNYNMKGISRSTLLQHLIKDKNNLEVLDNFLTNNPIGEEEIYEVGGLVDFIKIAISSLTGKWKPGSEDMADHWGFSMGELTPEYIKYIFDKDRDDEDLIHRILTNLFKNNAISPEVQKTLEDNYDIYKCDYTEDLASQARRDRRDKERDEYRKRREELEKQYAKSIDYSRMDTAGGSEDEGYAKYFENYCKRSTLSKW
jgi:hypothetical protein